MNRAEKREAHTLGAQTDTHTVVPRRVILNFSKKVIIFLLRAIILFFLYFLLISIFKSERLFETLSAIDEFSSA